MTYNPLASSFGASAFTDPVMKLSTIPTKMFNSWAILPAFAIADYLGQMFINALPVASGTGGRIEVALINAWVKVFDHVTYDVLRTP